MTIQHVQTKAEIAALLKAADTQPLKRFGQHFLIDGNLMRRLVASAELEPDDGVLEVGGGTGGLTDLLVAAAGKVVCVEIDQDLHSVLESRFRERSNFILIQADVLQSKHRLDPQVIDAIAPLDADPAGRGGCNKLVANLPYQVATPLIMNLLRDHSHVRRLCFTVQAEVGGRITAEPGTRAYGPLSILSQLLCSVRVEARLPASTFWPRPAVESVMLRMDRKDPALPTHTELRRFCELVRRTFEHRRKTLRSAMGYVVDDAQVERVAQSFDATRRPETFTIDEWLAIYQIVQK